MFRNARKIVDTLFSKNERHQMVWLFLGILVMGFVEMVGIASIMPFLAVVLNPQSVHTNKYLSFLYSAFHFRDMQTFLVWLGFGMLGLLMFNSVVSAGTMWLLLRFANLRGHVLSERLLATYLGQPYAFFLNRNGSELIQNTIEEVNRFIGGVAIPVMGTLVKAVVIAFIVGLLIAVDPVMAMMVMAVLGGSYLALFTAIRRKLARIGQESFEAAAERFKLASEGINGIKDLKILGREADQVRRYSVHSRLFAWHEASNQALVIMPRYALESLAFGGILLIVIYLISAGREASSIIPLISLYAFAGYRLIPAVQTVFASVSSVKYYLPTIEVLCRDLSLGPVVAPQRLDTEPVQRIIPTRMIELETATFTYPNAPSPVIAGLSLRVQAHTTVGLVGITGSGKTTIIDIVLGLLFPDLGRLVVDGVEILPANVRAWHRSVGYFSQQMYLSDDTIARNIAFGVPDDEIEYGAVERASRIANLHDFVTQELPQGYQTVVGDRGVRLSGGQRQRIGIARALYNDPPVVILDEATSAVDGATESCIMEAIHGLSNKTVIIIAHRLSTVRECDVIYVLERGKIAGQGTYAELMEGNTQFRRMANVN